jgi:hypothetical protein
MFLADKACFCSKNPTRTALLSWFYQQQQKNVLKFQGTVFRAELIRSEFYYGGLSLNVEKTVTINWPSLFLLFIAGRCSD